MNTANSGFQPEIIAEIGTSHGGDLKKAVEMVHAAVESGANWIKFQHVYAEEIIHPDTGLVDLPGGPTPLFDVFKSLEVKPDFLLHLKEVTEKCNARFLCSPFGERSLAEINDMHPLALKVASPELNHFPLLDKINRIGLPVFLSTGVSQIEDIKDAAAHLPDVPLTLLHCITSYPAPEDEYNLGVLESLRETFQVPVGVSDHSRDPLLVPLVSLLYGSVCHEKHFTLSRSDGGLDDPVALIPEDFCRMTKSIQEFSTLSREEQYRNLFDLFGKARVVTVAGDGIKKLAPSETGNYGRTNRSIHSLKEINKGETLNAKNCAVLRTEKNLSPGLSPRYWDKIIGKQAARSITSGQGITWPDVE